MKGLPTRLAEIALSDKGSVATYAGWLTTWGLFPDNGFVLGSE
jgi:hypothetical protein